MRTFIKTLQYYDFKMDTKEQGKKNFIFAHVLLWTNPPSFQSFKAKFVQHLTEKKKLHFYLLRSDKSILSKNVNQRLSDRHYTSRAQQIWSNHFRMESKFKTTIHIHHITLTGYLSSKSSKKFKPNIWMVTFWFRIYKIIT